MEQRFPDAC